jgi:hypothetical protein
MDRDVWGMYVKSERKRREKKKRCKHENVKEVDRVGRV